MKNLQSNHFLFSLFSERFIFRKPPEMPKPSPDAGAESSKKPDVLLDEGNKPKLTDKPLADLERMRKLSDSEKKEKIELGPESVFFRSENGEIIVYGDSYGDKLYFSTDGKIFYELNKRGFGGSSEEHHISFEDPHNNRDGEWNRKGDSLTFDGKIFKKTAGPKTIEALRLPIIRRPKYFFQLSDGRQIYVSYAKYSDSYKSFKLFIGQPGKMKEVKIKNVISYRDGGTIYIETAEGTLYSPTPFKQNETAKWNDKPIKKLDPSAFQITESGTGLQISK